MVVILDPSQCFQDSPHFRQDIELIEESTDRFAEALKKISAIAKKAIEADKAAIEANLLFAEEVANVVNVEGNTVYETESSTVSFFNRISQVLKQAQAQREQQLADLESSVLQSIQKFLSQDLSDVKKTRTKFDADYQDYENELMKYCAISKKKEAKGGDETQSLVNSLRASKKTFHGTSLSYCCLLNEVSSTRKLHFLESLVSYVYSLSSTTSKLHKSLEEMSPVLKDATIHIQETKGSILNEKKAEQAQATMLVEEGVQAFFRNLNPPATPTITNLKRENSSGSQTSVSSFSTNSSSKAAAEEDLLAVPSNESGPKVILMRMEGFLLKRSSGARKTWSRRYFILNLEECRLDYLSPKDSRLPIVAMYLIGGSIRESESDDRRFVLHISSSTVHYYLQAETEGEFNDWKQALTASIQHGPVEKSSIGSPKKLMPSTSFTSISSGISSNPRSVSGRTSLETLDELGIEEKSALLKSGELLFKKGAKKTLSRTLTKSSSQMSDMTSSSSSNEWKRVFASLSKDSRLVLFESDKDAFSSGRGSVRKPLLTKVVASVDLSSLENYAIQSTHDSITGRKYSFSIQTKERTIYLAGATQIERDEWVLICNRHLLEKNHDPSKLRTAATITAEIHEARGIPSGDPYCEIRVDELVLANTSAKSKTSTPYWGEDFNFDDIREVDIGVLITLKNQNNSRLQKDSVVGHCFISAEQLLVNQVCEGWFPLIKGAYTPLKSSDSKSEGSAKMEIKINLRYQTVDVMPLEKYKELSNILDETEAEPMFEITKLSNHLEGTARNLLRIFLGKGTVIAWLKKLVGTEILLTDNANVMFRANSIATKAIDQYMKVVGMEYLERTIGDVVRTICESKYSCEVDPTRLQKGEDLNQNWVRLIGFVTQVWNHIAKSASDMPKEFRSIFNHIQHTAHQKFGLDEAKSTVRYTTVSGFLFLRFFCPAVLTPKFFGLLNEHPDERTRRTLTLITKTLQCLANLGNFSVKEEFMQPMNEFLMDHTTSMMDFIDEASICKEEPENQVYPLDLEREFGEFHHFISNNRDALRQSKTPRIKTLLQVVDKLDTRLDSMSKMSLGAFLKMDTN